MPCGWKCPQSLRKRPYEFLMCKAFMKDGADYNLKENAIQAICAHQYLCHRSNKYENTKEAKACYQRHAGNI